MKTIQKYFLLIGMYFILPLTAFADENPAEVLLNSIIGVYKNRFENMSYDGSNEKFMSEDVIEIVRYSSDQIYFRVELTFANAHHCSAAGVAKYTNNSFVYESREKPFSFSDSPCIIKIWRDNFKLYISDRIVEGGDGTCTHSCGARGSLSDYQIDLSRRRKIKYMPLILNSREYKGSVQELNKAKD